MKRLSLTILAFIAAIALAVSGTEYFIHDALAQVTPGRPVFGPDTKVTTLTTNTLTVGGGGCTGCGGTPGGTTGQVQVNSSGSLAGISEGSSGQVLTSTGVGTAPTFQDAAGGGTTVYGGYAFDDNMGGDVFIGPSGWSLVYLGAGTWAVQTDIADSNSLWGTFNTEIPGTCVTVDTMGGSAGGFLNVTIVVDDCAGTPGDISGVYFAIFSATPYV